jgi:phage replication-related protein YjqB (UPF0714/DUF867 family)
MWERQGKEFSVHVREGSSGLAVIAPHGGDIEPGTTELADAIASNVHTFYCFVGIKRAKNYKLHITSEYFNEPKGVDIVGRSRAVLALHGCKGHEEAVYVGGLDTVLREKIRVSLIRAGFNAEQSTRPELQGRNEHNICNRCKSGKGVQLELSMGLRKKMFRDLTREGRKDRTTIFHAFVSVLRDVLSSSANRER